MVPIYDWVSGYQFKQTGGADSDILLHPPEICQGDVNATGQHKPLAFHMAEGLLHLPEEALRARQRHCHRAEFPQHFVSFLHTDALLCGGNLFQDGLELLDSVWGEVHCHVCCVYQPAKESFTRDPHEAACVQFLERQNFFSRDGIALVQEPQHLI